MKNTAKILQEISTHKAVLNGNKIDILIKGFSLDDKDPNGDPLWSDEDLRTYPTSFFQDELYYSIPAENEDDLFAIFEDLEEINRINVAEFNS